MKGVSVKGNTGYPKLLNFVLYEALWFSAILGQQAAQPVLILLLVAHLFLCRDWRSEAAIMLLAGGVGILVDSALALQGVYTFSHGSDWLPIPFWLMAIWLGFVGTLRHSMAYMLKRPLLASVAAGVFAPLSYLGAQRLGAVSFELGTWQMYLLIGLLWAAMMPVFIYICQQIRSEAYADVLSPLEAKS